MPKKSKPKVVAVDDDRDILLLLKAMMPKGIEFCTAHDVWSALDEANGAKLVLCDLDLELPDSDGIDVIKAMRERLGFSAKIYLVSGTADDGDVSDAIEAGADGFISKPFDVDKIQEIVSSLT